MNEKTVKITEKQIAEFLYDDITYQLEKKGISINSEFKYESVLRKEFVSHIDFSKVFSILSEKRKGSFSFTELYNGFSVRFVFKEV